LRQVAPERDQDRETADTVRRCAVTRALRPKDELIRFVLGPDGAVVPDLKVEEAIAKGRIIALVHAREAADDGCRKLDAKLRGKKGGTSLPAVRVFTVDELGLASGRTNVIHAALIQGGAALKVLAAASRLERYRKGSAAFRNPNELDTNNE